MTDRKIRTYMITAAIAIGLLVVGYFLWTTASYRQITVHDIPYTTAMHPHIFKDRIYAYNGMTFYSTSLTDAKDIKVLSDKAVLPHISELSWVGDKGVMFSTDASTLVDTSLDGKLSGTSDSTNQTWYLDFASGSVTLVSSGALSSLHAYFSESKNQVFYIATAQDEERSVNNLYTYTPGSSAASLLIGDIGYENAKDVGYCKDSVCVLQTNGDHMELWTVKDGKKSVVYSFKDYVMATQTGTPGLYVGSKGDENQENYRSDGSLLESTPELINVETGNVTKLQMKIGSGSGVLAGSFDSQKSQYYVVDTAFTTSNSETFYGSTGKTIFGNVRTNVKPFMTTNDQAAPYALGEASYGDNGTALYSSVEGDSFLITQQDTDYTSEGRVEDNVTTSLKTCLANHTASHTYDKDTRSLRVSLAYDGNYLKNISDFAACAAKTSPKSLVATEFLFVGVDPVSGRYVTN